MRQISLTVFKRTAVIFFDFAGLIPYNSISFETSNNTSPSQFNIPFLHSPVYPITVDEIKITKVVFDRKRQYQCKLKKSTLFTNLKKCNRGCWELSFIVRASSLKQGYIMVIRV